MISRFYRIILILVIAAGFVGMDGGIAITDSPLTMPFAIKANGSSFYRQSNLFIVTNKYLITADMLHSRTFFDVETGQIVPEAEIDLNALLRDNFINPYTFGKHQYALTGMNFSEFKMIGSDLFATGCAGKDIETIMIDPLNDLFAKCDKSTEGFSKITIFKAGSNAEFLKFTVDSKSYFEYTLIANHLFISSDQACTVVNAENGKLELTFKLPGSGWSYGLSGEYLLFGNYVFNAETLDPIYKIPGESNRFAISGSVCYDWKNDQTGWAQYTINSHDLVTGKNSSCRLELTDPVDHPHFGSGSLFGVVAGLAYVYNGKTGCFEMIELETEKVVFSQKSNHEFSRFFSAGNNGKQVVFTDSGSIFCVDIQNKKLSWTKDFPMQFLPTEKEGIYFHSYGENQIKYIDLRDPQKQIIMDISGPDAPRQEFSYSGKSIISKYRDGGMTNFKRFGWDGSVSVLPNVSVNAVDEYVEILETDYGIYLVKHTKNPNTAIVHKLEDKTWKTIFENQDLYHSFVFNERYVASRTDSSKLFIMDTMNGQQTIIDNVYGSYDDKILGRYFIGCEQTFDNVYNRKPMVVDLLDKKIVYSPYRAFYLGYDDDACYFLRNKKIDIIKDGKTIEIDTTFSPRSSNSQEFNVFDGFLLSDGYIYSMDGKMKQRITNWPDFESFRHENGRLFFDNLGDAIVNGELVSCSSYTLTNANGIVTLTNKGKLPMKGKYCLVEANLDFPAVKLQNFCTFSVGPEKSIQLTKLDSGKLQLLAIQADGMIEAEGSNFAKYKYAYDTYIGSFIDFDGTAWTLSLWGKDR